MAENGLVGPIKGASGVYMVQIDSKAQRAASEDGVKARMMQAFRNKSRMASQTLRDAAVITDNRNRFF